jgi:hypothetical protein
MINSFKQLNFLYYISVIVFIVTLMSSCNTSQILLGKHKRMTANEIISEHTSQPVLPKNLMLRFDANIKQNDQNQSATCFVRVKKDSLTWISIRTLSLEVFRAVLTNDSIQFYDRVNKLYYQGNYELIQKQFGFWLDYMQLQDILLGEMLAYHPFEMAELEVCNDSLFYCLEITPGLNGSNDSLVLPFHPDFVKQAYYFYPETFYLSGQYFSSLVSSDTFSVDYDSWQLFDTVYYPEFINLHFIGEGESSIHLNTKSVRIDASMKTSFKIPDNYEHIRF